MSNLLEKELAVEKLMTVSDVARALKMPPSTIYRRAKIGEIPSMKFNRSIRFSSTDVLEYLRKSRRG